MSFNFSQTVTKLVNGKNMTRPSLLPKFLMLPKNTQYICLCNPLNPLLPITPFLSAIDDITATDWDELV